MTGAVQESFRVVPDEMMFEGVFGIADFATQVAGVRAIEYGSVSVVGHGVAYDGVLDAVAFLVVYSHV